MQTEFFEDQKIYKESAVFLQNGNLIYILYTLGLIAEYKKSNPEKNIILIVQQKYINFVQNQSLYKVLSYSFLEMEKRIILKTILEVGIKIDILKTEIIDCTIDLSEYNMDKYNLNVNYPFEDINKKSGIKDTDFTDVKWGINKIDEIDAFNLLLKFNLSPGEYFVIDFDFLNKEKKEWWEEVAYELRKEKPFVRFGQNGAMKYVLNLGKQSYGIKFGIINNSDMFIGESTELKAFTINNKDISIFALDTDSVTSRLFSFMLSGIRTEKTYEHLYSNYRDSKDYIEYIKNVIEVDGWF